MSDTKRILIIDSLNNFLRQYIKNPSISSNGNPIGGLKGFFTSLQKLCRETKPDLIVCVWDGAQGSLKKRSTFKDYKQGRKPLKLNRNIVALNEEQDLENKIWQQVRTLELLNICPVIQLKEEYIEADDLISYVAQKDMFKDWIKIIVSSDKDFIQLCNDKTILFRPAQEQILNTKKIIEEFGIHPRNFALARAISGDASDNIAGIGGAGLPTVAKRFPFLSENKQYSIQDLVEYSKSVDSKVQLFETVIEKEDTIRENYNLMQLSTPNMSLQTKSGLDYVFDNIELQFNKTEFIKNILTDGFGEVNFNDLYTTFNRIIANHKKT